MRRTSLLLAFLAAATSIAFAQVLDVHRYSTSGHPTEAIWTPDGRYVLVTVTERGSSAIEVFHVEPDGKLKHAATQHLGNEGAQGIRIIPHSDLVAVGLSNSGVAFVPLSTTLEGKARPGALQQGAGSGSGYLAVTPDGKALFVANEYGEGGNVGVISLADPTKPPAALAKIPTPRATPGISISPDGSRVYTVGEIVPEEAAAKLPGHDNPELHRDGCLQGSGRAQSNGVLYVLDTGKAEAANAGGAILRGDDLRPIMRRRIDAGCSPVRQAITADGSTLYLTARGDNKILAFDTHLLETDPDHAFLRSIPSGGEAPVGIGLFDGDHKLLIANSNRFRGGPGNATVIDISNPAAPKAVQTIPTGEFPRNITVSADGRTLLLTEFLGDELLVLTMK